MAKARRLRDVALLSRLPRLRRYPPVEKPWPGKDWPVVDEKHVSEFPELGDDLAVWMHQLEPRFRLLDHRAQVLQNQFWRQHLALILGGLLATAFGAIQAANRGGVEWLAAGQAVLTGILAGLTVLVRSRRPLQGYLDARLKAERIKSEFYLFLARAGDYARNDRLATLQQQVDDIEAAESVA